MPYALSLVPRCRPTHFSRYCASAAVASFRCSSTGDMGASVTLTPGGLPRFHVPLPSRDETCIFALRPLSNTVGDLVKAIEAEDKGVDRVAFLGTNGLRFAKSNSIEMLLANDFVMEINDKKFPVSISNLGLPEDIGPKELGSVRALISRLNTVLTAEDINAEKEREIKKRIADVQLQLEPFEEKRQALAQMASTRTRRLTWLGLGAMGLQFGLLARLTWWEYSWDIMEPVTYFVGYGTTMAMYAYFVVTRQDYSFPGVFDREYLKAFYKGAAAQGFDVERYNSLREMLAELQCDLRRLRDPLYINLPLQQTKYLVKECFQESH
ncbi:coiled coil domain containing protein 109A [Echinococcus multilocularis]|uniref:Calcium uniporter protein n=1 Tax=Echinococcus multilocularis TaxID=6211 RepID=A0A068Y265_ECHMU|nr:coiled coil domain containing protein 109A [Echinococcus multilocularis]